MIMCSLESILTNKPKTIKEIFRHIKQSSNQVTKHKTKKALIDKISMRLLTSEFKSDNTL